MVFRLPKMWLSVPQIAPVRAGASIPTTCWQAGAIPLERMRSSTDRMDKRPPGRLNAHCRARRRQRFVCGRRRFCARGHETRLWRRDKDAVAAHRAAGGKISSRISKAAMRRRLLSSPPTWARLCVERSSFCRDFGYGAGGYRSRIGAALVRRQVVFLPPGHSTGAAGQGGARLRQSGKDRIRRDRDVAMADAQAWAIRIRYHHPRETASDRRLSADDEGSRARHYRKAFPGVIEDCGDALSAALMNAGPVIHPPRSS